MFDNVTCKYPLPTAQDEAFQTKDLENALDNYEIREDGTLWIEEYDIEDRSNPNATGIARIFGMGTRVNERWARSYFSGEVNFYTNLNENYDKWIEYRAIFKDGVIQSLEIIKDDSQN